MESILLRIRVRRGVNLAVRDTLSSDPYVLVTMGEQKLKTRVVKNNCNPEWNDELTLSITDLETPITLTVFDRDTLTSDDKMGDAEIDIKPYIECLKMGLENRPDGSVVKRIQPSHENCLSDESSCVWTNGKIVQDMCLRLRNVECGKIVVQIEWINFPGCKGLIGDEAKNGSLDVEASKGLLGVEGKRGLFGVEAAN
ncbi:protein C2-DOMAIN ABA-RELATED 7 [Morus notabilis]|uniref:protein C2-DOMAIN ABA-RELATED 7 n=1 Tax=Morus notabilis TaxID=981085 RepID=UPI000CED62FC|nr:protein C2-DOMAIN ABA-RELATED 7 [Morus notabilis]